MERVREADLFRFTTTDLRDLHVALMAAFAFLWIAVSVSQLREAFPNVVVAAAEPLPGDPVMGLRSLEDGYVPPILDVSQLDRKLLVSNAESVAGMRALAARERSRTSARHR